MCIRDSARIERRHADVAEAVFHGDKNLAERVGAVDEGHGACLLYTSDAADERSSVDLGGRRIIKKKTVQHIADESYQR